MFGQFGDDGSRDNSSLSWAEFYLYDDFTVTPCVTSDNASCSNVTSLDTIAEYPYTVWQVSHSVTFADKLKLLTSCPQAAPYGIKPNGAGASLAQNVAHIMLVCVNACMNSALEALRLCAI